MLRMKLQIIFIGWTLFSQFTADAEGQVKSFWIGQADVSAPDATEAMIMDRVPPNGFVVTDIVIGIRGDLEIHHLIRLSERDNETSPFIDKFAGRFIDNGNVNPDRKLEYHFASGIALSPGKQVWMWNLPFGSSVTISGYVPQANQKNAAGISPAEIGLVAVVALALLGMRTPLISMRRKVSH